MEDGEAVDGLGGRCGIILPIIAGLSALSIGNVNIAAQNAQSVRGLIAPDIRIELIVFCIIIIILALIVTVGVDFKQQPGVTTIAAAGDFKIFISTISEYVGVYLMILFGLKAQSQ